MGLITWSDELSVQVEVIDKQHKNWIGIFNKMHESMLSDNYKAFNAKMEEYVREMIDYTDFHFLFEEEYMKSINYPGLNEHMRKHKKIKDILGEAARDILTGKMTLKSNFLNMTRNWLLDHIMIEDKKYCIYAAQREAHARGNLV